jgi:hypothetical protein
MRYRSTIDSNCPIIPTIEWSWNKSVSPYQAQFVTRISEDLPYPGEWNWTTPNAYPSFKEEIWDETGKDGRFRDCLHTVETNGFDNVYLRHQFFKSCGGNAYLRGFGQAGANPVVNSLALRTAPSIDMEAMANEACAFMLPRLNENTSLVNSILELKDFKRMNPTGTIQRLQRRHLALKHLADPRVRRRFVKETTKRLNDAHLQAQFGIVPFVQDVVGIYDDLTSLAFRLEQLKRNAGIRQQRHYKRIIPGSPGVAEDREWRSSLQTNIHWVDGVRRDSVPGPIPRNDFTALYQARWTLRPVYHATMRYVYTLPALGNRLEGIYSKLDALGVRLDPSIIWNAIPFSFVVDWVVDVSGFLSSFARDNFPIDVHITDFCHSYSWRKEMTAQCRYVDKGSSDFGYPPYAESNRVGPNWVPVYSGSRSYYNRVRFTPDIHTARAKSPKLRQAALAGSLLLAQSKKLQSSAYQNLTTLPSKRSRRR